MSKPGLSFGLSLNKKPGGAKKAVPPKRKTAFGGGDSDDETVNGPKTEEVVTELDSFGASASDTNTASASTSKIKSNSKVPNEPPKLKSKTDPSRQFGDLSSALTSRKYAEAAEALDPSVYDYDAAYDVIKAVKKQHEAEAKRESAQRKSRYMADVTKAAEQRERDRGIAELKKIQREREEGDEFADTEKFVTEAYKKKQEEDRKAEEEERKREEEERKKNKFGGMTGFHKEVLEREDQKRLEMEIMAAEAAKSGALPNKNDDEKGKTETDVAREINAKGGAIAVNEEGEVVDKRQLLRGGLNLGAKKKTDEPNEAARTSTSGGGARDQSRGYFGSGGKQAMRERQTRMLEAQLEQAAKRAREEEEEERKKVELESKSRKTAADISSAKERYLARKKAAEEAKKNGEDAP